MPWDWGRLMNRVEVATCLRWGRDLPRDPRAKGDRLTDTQTHVLRITLHEHDHKTGGHAYLIVLLLALRLAGIA
jgi:hypothetical protein